MYDHFLLFQITILKKNPIDEKGNKTCNLFIYFINSRRQRGLGLYCVEKKIEKNCQLHVLNLTGLDLFC